MPASGCGESVYEGEAERVMDGILLNIQKLIDDKNIQAPNQEGKPDDYSGKWSGGQVSRRYE